MSERWVCVGVCLILCAYLTSTPPSNSFFCCSVSVMFYSLWPHGLQYAKLTFSSLSHEVLKLVSIESLMAPNHLILCHPLLLLPSIFHSIRVFSNDSVLCIRWPKYWSFSFIINPSNEYSVLISFRIDWLDFLAVQGTLKRFLKYHSSKTSILWHSAFSIDQLYIHTWLLDKP